MHKEDKVRDIIEREITSHYIAGANVLAIKDNQIIYNQSFGYSNLEQKIQMQQDTIFRLYSLSKPITAVGILMLVDQGKLALTDQVSKYIDTFHHPLIATGDALMPIKREVTIYDLLTMTSGIVYPEGDNAAGSAVAKVYDQCICQYENGQPTMTTLEFVKEIGKCPLAFEPGKEWRYGTSADVLGAVIEVITKQTLGDYLDEALFKPLSMEDTGFFIPKEKWHRQAIVYENDEDTGMLKPYDGYNLAIFDPKKKPEFESGGAGIVSTIGDYAKFACMLLQEGYAHGKQFLSKELLRLMKQNHLNQEQKRTFNWESTKGCGYGFLVRMLINEQESSLKAGLGAYGWDGWTGPYVSIDDSNQMIVLYFIAKINTGTTMATIQVHNELLNIAKSC